MLIFRGMPIPAPWGTLFDRFNVSSGSISGIGSPVNPIPNPPGIRRGSIGGRTPPRGDGDGAIGVTIASPVAMVVTRQGVWPGRGRGIAPGNNGFPIGLGGAGVGIIGTVGCMGLRGVWVGWFMLYISRPKA